MRLKVHKKRCKNRFAFISGKFFNVNKFTVDLEFGFLLIKSYIKM